MILIKFNGKYFFISNLFINLILMKKKNKKEFDFLSFIEKSRKQLNKINTNVTKDEKINEQLSSLIVNWNDILNDFEKIVNDKS